MFWFELAGAYVAGLLTVLLTLAAFSARVMRRKMGGAVRPESVGGIPMKPR